MDLNVLNTATTSAWGWIGGGGLATVVMAALQLRRRLSRDGVERHKDSAEKGIIDRLSEELDKAGRRVDLAEQRASESFERRDAMLRELAPIYSTMAAMEERMKRQAEQIITQQDELKRLREGKRDAT
jgi:hypothetical protein